MQECKLKSILLIDDDEDEYDLVQEAVQSSDPGLTVSFLSRQEEAEKYRGQKFDLILLDINMPHRDGFSWLKCIREKGYDMPVVMYTNSASPAHIAKAYQEGATLYFNKPDSYTQLVNGLGKLFSLNWNDRESITSRYAHDGHYETFH
jgi:DNA-binding NtrC family response regulator